MMQCGPRQKTTKRSAGNRTGTCSALAATSERHERAGALKALLGTRAARADSRTARRERIDHAINIRWSVCGVATRTNDSQGALNFPPFFTAPNS